MTNLSPELLDNSAKFFLLFSGQLLMPIIFIGMIFDQRRFLNPTLLLLFAMIFSATLKLIFGIPYSPELAQKLGKDGLSFPSGHMQATVTFYGWFLITNNNNWLRLILVLIMAGVGFGLVEQGYHSVYDVLGGLGFSAFTIGFYQLFIFAIKNQKVSFPKQLAGPMLLLFLSIILIIIMLIFYQLPNYLIMVIYSILGINLALYLSQNFAESPKNKTGTMVNLILIIIGIAAVIAALSAIKFEVVFLQQIKWIFIAFLLPYLAILVRKLRNFRIN